MEYGYDKNVDYQKLINQDVAAQDFRSAAIHEAQRNAKIRGEGATQYQTTSHYADYLPRDAQISSGMDRLAEQKQFTWDKDQDPSYQAMRKELLREADRQTRNAMGAAAGMTGGTPSTAAVMAGQQAGQYQVAQLADRVPQLYEAAFNRWNTQREQDRSDLSLLAGLEGDRADRSLAQQQWDWNRTMGERQQGFTEQQAAIANAMDRWTTMGAADEFVASILGVPVGTGTQSAAYQAWQQQMAERQQTMSEQDTAYDRAMDVLQTGSMPTAEQLAAAGISQADAQRIAAFYAAQIARQTAGGTSGGGSSGGGRTYRGSYSSGGGNKQIKTDDDGTDKKDEGSGLTDAEYQTIRTNILYAMQIHNVGILQEILQNANGLSDEQYAEIVRMVEKAFPELIRSSGNQSGYPISHGGRVGRGDIDVVQ